MLFTVLSFAFYMNATAHSDSLAPSASQSAQFQEAKPSRGPASISATPEAVEYKEIEDTKTEAGYCLFCSSTGAMRTSTLSEQGREILEQAKRSADGK